MKNDINAGTASRLLQFADAMDAMKLAGGQIYYFVLDYDSDSSVWDKVLYAFEQMFSYLDTQLLIIDIPEKYTRRKDFEQVNAIIDRFCVKCQGIIKYVNENGAESTLFKHIGVYISGNDVKLAPYIKKAKESGIIIKKASDWVKDFSDSPFLTKSGSRKPLISICIPTFNRAHCLPITLDTLIHQPEFEQGLVEIVISDNASSDNTEEVGRYYSDNFSMIRYFKNDMNIRDGNFRLALNRGTGLLRKLNNDTCIHRSDSLSYMCRMAKKYAYIKPAIYFGNSPGNGDNDSLHTMRSFLKKESFHITWIASFATWDEDCGGDEDQYIYGDQLWQVRRLIHLIEKRKVVAACDKMFMNGMIYNKNYSASWLWEVFHDQYFDIVGNYLTEKDKEVIEADLLFNHFEIVKKTSELYPENMKIDKDFDAVVKEHYGDKPYWDAYCKDYQQWHDETFIEGRK